MVEFAEAGVRGHVEFRLLRWRVVQEEVMDVPLNGLAVDPLVVSRHTHSLAAEQGKVTPRTGRKHGEKEYELFHFLTEHCLSFSVRVSLSS